MSVIRENLRPIIFGAILAALTGFAGYLWAIIVDGVEMNVRQQEQIETNTSWIEANKGRISNDREEKRVDKIVSELRSIKQTLENQ